MTDELRSRALALPAAERAELAHALMDSLYEEMDWDTGAEWRVEPAASAPLADVVDMSRARAARRT